MIIDFEYQPLLEDYKKNGDMLLGSILKILENSGNKHSDAAGDAILEGSNNGKAWVLTDWMIDVINYPKYGDKIVARTWSEPVNHPLICTRNFEMYCNGELSVKGTTKWILLDLTTNRPIKITQEIIDKYQPEDKHTYEDSKLPKLIVPESFSRETPIAIRRLDIDFNDHVHNLTYLDYALEGLPEEVFENRNFKKLRISYKVAVKSGEEIICKYAENEGRHICCIYGTNGDLKTQIEFD